MQKFGNRENTLGCGILNATFSGIADIYKTSGMDYVLVDCEHGTLNDVCIEELLRACRRIDLPAIVRVAGIHQTLVARPMDMGADGIMVPRVETLAQLDEVVRYWRFPPRGKKGFGGYAQLRPDESIADLEYVNSRRILSIQIESREGAKNLNAMLDKYSGEVQLILIGPADLSIDVGTPGDLRSEAQLETLGRIANVCKSYGKSLGIYCSNAAEMQFYRDCGINVMWVASELTLLACEVSRTKGVFDGLRMSVSS